MEEPGIAPTRAKHSRCAGARLTEPLTALSGASRRHIEGRPHPPIPLRMDVLFENNDDPCTLHFRQTLMPEQTLAAPPHHENISNIVRIQGK